MAEEGQVKVFVQEVIEGVLEEGKEVSAWNRASSLLEEGRIRGKVVFNVRG